MADTVRQTAGKVSIKDINDATYVVQAGWDPNFLTLPDGREVYRVNVMGIVVSFQSDVEMLVDDGTSQIIIRGLQETQGKDIGLGDLVQVIGKSRVFNDQKYLTPEAIKKVSERTWMDVRRKELQTIKEQLKAIEKKIIPQKVHEQEKIIGNLQQVQKTERNQNKNEENNNPVEIIFQFIKKEDDGEGVLVDKIIEKVKIPQTEQIITTLWMEGNIFEIKPGRVKVLE